MVQLVRNQYIKEGIPFIPPQMEEVRDLCSLCKYVIIDPNNAKMLQRAIKNPKVHQEIALTRFKEFGEISMFYEKYVYSGQLKELLTL